MILYSLYSLPDVYPGLVGLFPSAWSFNFASGFPLALLSTINMSSKFMIGVWEHTVLELKRDRDLWLGEVFSKTGNS